MWVGFSVFLVMLLFAVQVLFNLYAASVVTAVSFDAARRVAGSDGGQASSPTPRIRPARRWAATPAGSPSTGAAPARMRSCCGCRADNPSVLLPVLAGPAAFDRLDRPSGVRVERFPVERASAAETSPGRRGMEVIPFGLLTFVVGALLVANAWAVIDAKMAVSAAAREATRAYRRGAGRR